VDHFVEPSLVTAYIIGVGTPTCLPKGLSTQALVLPMLCFLDWCCSHSIGLVKATSPQSLRWPFCSSALLLRLAAKSVSTNSAAGISAGALTLDAFALCCQLSSTTWLQGYLPADASGDWLFQILQVYSLAVAVWLLYRVLVCQKATYQSEADSCPMGWLILVCLSLASVLHSDLNARPLFDTLWMTGLFASVVAVLPQLWLVNRTGGCVDYLTGHYIASLAVSRGLSGLFMFAAWEDITCDEWITGFNHAVLAVNGAHLLHLILLGDFGWHYVKAMAQKGLTSSVQLGDDFAWCV